MGVNEAGVAESESVGEAETNSGPRKGRPHLGQFEAGPPMDCVRPRL